MKQAPAFKRGLPSREPLKMLTLQSFSYDFSFDFIVVLVLVLLILYCVSEKKDVVEFWQ